MQIVSALLLRHSETSFVKTKQVLLCLRKNTLHFPDHWSLPSGHVESLENNIDALRRELYEEIAIQLLDCELFTTLFDNELNIENNIYRVTDWRGTIENMEPRLCSAVKWFSLDKLPVPLTVVTQSVIKSL